MPAKNKKNFRSTKSGAGMTKAGVKAYRRLNPGSKLLSKILTSVNSQKFSFKIAFEAFIFLFSFSCP